MRQRLLIIFLVVLSSCKDKQNNISLEANPTQAKIYNYQDIDCQFIAHNLNNSYDNKTIDSIKFTTSFSFMEEEVRHNRQEFRNDTITMSIRGDLMVPDSVTETFTEEMDTITVYGELTTYSSNNTEKLNDTITIYIENPLKNNRMVGKIENGKRGGQWLEYYDEKLTELARKSYFIDGKRHGTDSIFKDEKLYYLINWKEGQKHGSFKIFWSNGQVKWQTEYEYGKPISPVNMYNFSGEKTGQFEL